MTLASKAEEFGMDAIYNERLRLLATALNNTAVAIFATAIIAPIAGFLYGVTTADRPLDISNKFFHVKDFDEPK